MLNDFSHLYCLYVLWTFVVKNGVKATLEITGFLCISKTKIHMLPLHCSSAVVGLILFALF